MSSVLGKEEDVLGDLLTEFLVAVMQHNEGFSVAVSVCLKCCSPFSTHGDTEYDAQRWTGS